MFFFSKKQRQVVARVLFIYAKLNPGQGYVQGMNEIIGPIYYVFANDNKKEWAGKFTLLFVCLFKLEIKLFTLMKWIRTLWGRHFLVFYRTNEWNSWSVQFAIGFRSNEWCGWHDGQIRIFAFVGRFRFVRSIESTFVDQTSLLRFSMDYVAFIARISIAGSASHLGFFVCRRISFQFSNQNLLCHAFVSCFFFVFFYLLFFYFILF